MSSIPGDKPESIRELIGLIDSGIYENLKQAVEVGKWQSGERLGPDQIAHCLQAIIAYENLHIKPESRVGYIDRSKLNDKNKANRVNVLARQELQRVAIQKEDRQQKDSQQEDSS